MTTIQKIEAYIVLATGMKSAFPEVAEMQFRILDIPMDEFHHLSKKFGKDPEKFLESFTFSITNHIDYRIFIYSVPVVKAERMAGVDHTDLTQDLAA